MSFYIRISIVLCIWFLGILANSKSFDQTDYIDTLAMIGRFDDLGTQLKIQNLNKYHFVFVGGFGNFLAGERYFEDNELALIKLGAGHVSRLMPSSRRSARQNIPLLAEKIAEIYREGGRRPIILIGHSKGGLESVATILHQPELIRNKIVQSVVAIQAPLSACELGRCSSQILSKTRDISPFQGLHSLHTEDIQRLIEGPLRSMHPRTRKMLSDKVFYITSEQKPGKTARIIRASSFLLQAGFKQRNDGLVSVPGMIIPGFGQELGHLIGDHFELTVSPSNIGRMAGLTTSMSRNIWAFSFLMAKSVTEYLTPTKNSNQCAIYYKN